MYFFLQGFNSHLPLSALDITKNIRVIPTNSEQIKIICFGMFKFIDSYSFQSSSLSSLSNKLAAQLHSQHKEFEYVKQVSMLTWSKPQNGGAEKYDPSKYKYVTANAAFPYKLATSIAALKAITTFPPKETFTNDLTGKTISDEVYQNSFDSYTDLKCKISHWQGYTAHGLLLASLVALRAPFIHFRLNSNHSLALARIHSTRIAPRFAGRAQSAFNSLQARQQSQAGS